MAKKTQVFVLLLSGLLLLVVSAFVMFVILEYTSKSTELSHCDPLDLSYLKHYIEVFKIVVVGVVVTLISLLIPFVFSQAKAEFERYKEARSAYSRAKTAVLYLPDRVLKAEAKKTEGASEEFKFVEGVHRELHRAETFADDIINQGFLDWYDEPKFWTLQNYWRIIAVAASLRWYTRNKESKEELKKKLEKTLTIVDKHFGERGENWRKYKEKEANEAACTALKEYRNKQGAFSRLWLWTRFWQKRVVCDRARRRKKEEYLMCEIEEITGFGTTLGLREPDVHKNTCEKL